MAIIAVLETFFPYDEIEAADKAMKLKPAHSFYLNDSLVLTPRQRRFAKVPEHA